MRKSHGAFKSVDDLLAVRGIGRKRLDKMRKYLTVGKPAAVGKPSTATNSTRAANCPGCTKAAPATKAAGNIKPSPKKAEAKHPAEPDDEPEEPDLR
jgi:uncharacterized NAD-dependent epimerase/dehydratase family protein